jgi:hypothetical protein
VRASYLTAAIGMGLDLRCCMHANPSALSLSAQVGWSAASLRQHPVPAQGRGGGECRGGRQQNRPAWRQGTLNAHVLLQELQLFLDSKLDESYTPSKVSIRAGTAIHDLQVGSGYMHPVACMHLSSDSRA